MYRMFTELPDFLDAGVSEKAPVQLYAIQGSAPAKGPEWQTSSIVLTARPPTGSGVVTLVARLLIEETCDPNTDGRTRYAIGRRAEAADKLIAEACHKAGLHVPTLSDPIAKETLRRLGNLTPTAHDLWTWERPDPDDSASWELLPLEP